MIESARSAQTLPLVAALLDRLDHDGIEYVHWKSNINIVRALEGDDDLDVLVHPARAEDFDALIRELGFRRSLSRKDSWQPNMLHFFALDAVSGRMVHLHLHYGLTLGYDFDKNFTLPIVDWYLENRRWFDGIALPAAEREYVVFVLRLLIKHAMAVAMVEAPLRQIRTVRSRRWRPDPLTRSERRELGLLREQADRDLLRDAIDRLPLDIDLAEFERYEAALAHQRGDAILYGASRRLKQRLRAFRASGEVASLAKAWARLNAHRGRTMLRKAGGLSVDRANPAGGRVIAFVGGDGAGKSSNVAALESTLRPAVTTAQIHVGRPRRSAAGLLLAVVARVLKTLGFNDTGAAVRHVGLARDRRSAFRRAKHVRSRGGVAILDRIPRPEIIHMDGPRITAPTGRIARGLSRYEHQIYRGFDGADLLVVLKLDPEIACQRRPEDDRDTLLKRSGEVWRADWRGASTHEIDTGLLDLDAVTRQVADIAWRSMGEPPLRTEVVGLSGTGKTTLVGNLAVEYPNMRRTLPYWRYPGSVLASVLSQVRASGIPRSTLDREMLRNLAQLRWFIRVQPRLTRVPMDATNYVLDQGPVFQLILGLKEGYLRADDEIVSKGIEAISEWLSDGVVLLEASDEVLRTRVLARNDQPTRAARLATDDHVAMNRDYRIAFSKVLDRLPVIHRVAAAGTEGEMTSAAVRVLRSRR